MSQKTDHVNLSNNRGEISSNIRLLRKLATDEEFVQDTGRKATGVYSNVYENWSTESTRKLPFVVEFPNANKIRESFKTKPGQPPKHIYRVPNLKATTLLQKAVVNGNIEQVEKLLTRAVDLSRKWQNGDTPSSYALSKKDLKMFTWLLKHGADPNITNAQGQTLLHVAVDNNDKSTAELLLQYKADPNKKNQKGWTPLHVTVEKKDTIMTEFLLANGADPNITNAQGQTPLHVTVDNDDKSTAELLLQYKADPNMQDEKGETPLQLTLKNANITGRAKKWQKVKKYYKIAYLLLENGADSNKKYPNGSTPLHVTVEKKDKSTAELLLQYKADPNMQDEKGETPLHIAVDNNDKSTAELLLQYKADPNIPDNSGYVALYWAAELRQNMKMTKLLINNGANPDILRVGDRQLSLYWTVFISKNKEMTKLLVEKGANLNFYSKYHSPSYLVGNAIISGDKDDVKFFVQYGSFVDVEYENASNILEYALMNGHKEIAAIILENMSDKNISDPSKGSLLDPILRKMISNQLNHKESEKMNKIKQLSDLLEIFTVDTPNLENKGCLFGITTLPLLEKLYNLYLCPNTLINENIPGSRIINSMGRGIKKLFDKAPAKQEEINDVPVDQSLEILLHNFRWFVEHFMQVVPGEVSEKYPSITALSLNGGPRNLKSARKDVVPPEQSPEFLQQREVKVQAEFKIISSENRDNDALHLSGDQDPKHENDNSD